ncbi:MAG: PhoU domain-containing protein [Candidatus Lokiarchaeia archaeon]
MIKDSNIMQRDEKDENLEFRKIQTLGKSSYVISLPKDWIDKNKIKRGDKLAVYKNPDGTLEVSYVNQKASLRGVIPEVNEVIIDDLNKDELEAVIIGNYLMGYNNFKLVTQREYLNSFQRKIITNTLNALTGFQIVSESPKVIEIKNLFEQSNFDVKEIAKRLGLLISFMLKDLIEALKEKNLEALDDIIAQDEEIDSLYLLMRRLLIIGSRNVIAAKKIGIEDNALCVTWSVILKKIETIADYVVRISEITKTIFSRDKVEIPEEIFLLFLKIGESITKTSEKVLLSYFEKDAEKSLVTVEDLMEFSELKNSFTQKIIEYEIDKRLLISLENICFYFEEIANYYFDYARDLIHYRLYFR